MYSDYFRYLILQCYSVSYYFIPEELLTNFCLPYIIMLFIVTHLIMTSQLAFRRRVVSPLYYLQLQGIKYTLFMVMVSSVLDLAGQRFLRMTELLLHFSDVVWTLLRPF